MSLESSQDQVSSHLCLLLCIRKVGCFNGNTDKTLCWSAVCAASDVLGCRCMCTELSLKAADLPTKTTWEKRQRRTSYFQHNGGRHATQSGSEVGDDWEGCCSEY